MQIGLLIEISQICRQQLRQAALPGVGLVIGKRFNRYRFEIGRQAVGRMTEQFLWAGKNIHQLPITGGSGFR